MSNHGSNLDDLQARVDAFREDIVDDAVDGKVTIAAAVRAGEFHLTRAVAELALRVPGPAQYDPEMREVPVREVRSGDHIMISGILRIDSDAIHPVPFVLTGPTVSVARAVPPLPDRPGSVISCRIKGLVGERIAERGDGVWLTPGSDRSFPEADITLVRVLRNGWTTS